MRGREKQRARDRERGMKGGDSERQRVPRGNYVNKR